MALNIAFVCEECDDSDTETIMRFCGKCPPGERTHVAGYRCMSCGHDDLDPEGEEWGHSKHE